MEVIADKVKQVALGESPASNSKKAKQPKKPAGEDASARPLELSPPPAFLKSRVELFDKIQARQKEELAKKPRHPITITMPDGSVKQGVAWETTPGEIARGISNSLYKRTIVARLNGDDQQLWDLERPLESSCKLELLDFSDPQGKFVFWHSSAHILGEATERRFGCSLCIGPPVDDGFYYEMALPDGAAVVPDDWKPLETIVSKVVKEKQKFERLVMTKEELLEMFAYNKYKQHIIKDKIPDGTSTTVYRNGPLIDLCRGPHVPDTGRIETFSIMRASASYFLGDAKNDSLQRIYGISFPDKKQMAEHKKFLEEAAKRDHRKIGKDQELFFFHEHSPGSAFWLPDGMVIFNAIQTYIREIYFRRRYKEVQTPNMFNSALWKQSGHWKLYAEDMFTLDVDGTKFGLKPMNCPSHCLMFGHRVRSYAELPLRFADFGVLHRNEASGALSGLTRVRRFQQDDAHIFCREDQVEEEVFGCFDFLKEMYGLMDLTFKLKLSTRPDKYLGDIETWDRAESQLKAALNKFSEKNGGTPWSLNPGDGAFYGPKIDIVISDSLKREWQTATIQLDFQQPQNFNLQYVAGKSASAAPASSDSSAPPPSASAAQKKPSAPASSDSSAAPPSSDSPAPLDADGKPEVTAESFRKELPKGFARPVMIHRAMAGSLERFTALLTEHFAGKWPFWLSPRQVLIIPVGKGFLDYAKAVQEKLYENLILAEVDESGETLQKKIRAGQLAQFNFIFVVGAEEEKGRQVNVRDRDDPATQDRGHPIELHVAIEKLVKLKADRGRYHPFPKEE
jgi:threonyl-tRNA synthetase